MTKICQTCKGTGWIEDDNYGRDCHKCYGSGVIVFKPKSFHPRKKVVQSGKIRDGFSNSQY